VLGSSSSSSPVAEVEGGTVRWLNATETGSTLRWGSGEGRCDAPGKTAPQLLMTKNWPSNRADSWRYTR
jgi:hypothetical protein